MVIAAALTLSAALATAALGLWSLIRRQPLDPVGRTLRSVAPTQLAAAVMLTAGGAAALAAASSTGVLMLTVCVAGALGTLAAGCYQGARVVAALEAGATASDCAGSCAACSLSCK